MAKLKIINNYGIAPNLVLNSVNLTWRAKGMFTYLQSKPENWRFSIERIKKDSPSGKQEVRSALHELEKAGLLVRVASKEAKSGKWAGYDYELRESPSSTWPTTVRPTTVRPNTLSKQEESNKEDIKKEDILAAVAANQTNDLLELFKDVNPSYQTLFPNKTQRSAAERMLKAHGLEKLSKIIKFLDFYNSLPFHAPVTTPLELERDMAKIRVEVIKLKNKEVEIKSRTI